MSSPVPVRQRFRPGIDEIPDDVLEQIAHAGDCAIRMGHVEPLDPDGVRLLRAALRGRRGFGNKPRCPIAAKEWRAWYSAARWAARLLGVEVR